MFVADVGWRAAWHKWCRTAVQYKSQRASGRKVKSTDDVVAEMARDANVDWGN